MGAVRIKLNRAGVGALLRGEAIEALREPADAVLARAQALAPVDLEAHDPGEYRNSLRLIHESPTDRARIAVGSSVPYALEVEMRHGVLGKAI